MAVVTTYAKAAKDVRSLDTNLFAITEKRTLAATGIANGDNVQMITIPHPMRLINTHLAQRATLGASATVKVQLNRSGARSDLTTATTAGGASIVSGATIGAVDLLAGDIIELLSGGANVTSAAAVELDLICQRA